VKKVCRIDAIAFARRIIAYPMTAYKIASFPFVIFSGSPPEEVSINAAQRMTPVTMGAPRYIRALIIETSTSIKLVAPSGLGRSAACKNEKGRIPRKRTRNNEIIYFIQ
jgi:hypothetical protein